MKKLKSLKDFQRENPEVKQIVNANITGGIAIDTFERKFEDTLDSWNCAYDCCTRYYGDGADGRGCYTD